MPNSSESSKNTYNFKVIDLIFGLKHICTQKEQRLMKQLNLTESEYRALAALSSLNSFGCVMLAKQINLSKSRTSRIIDKLLQNKFIAQSKSASDRRQQNYILTRKGKNAADKINKVMNECEKQIRKSLKPSDIKSIRHLITEISSVISKS